MTNILYWNIRQFSINLINIPMAQGGGNINAGAGGLTNAVVAQQRLAIIMNVIAAAGADIISIVEVQTGANPASDLAVDSGGLQAASFLLNQLRAWAPASQWRMVPPLWLGARQNVPMPPAGRAPRAESVAVLYRGVTGNVSRYFTGPNLWTGGAGGVSEIPGGVAPGNYPVDFNEFIDDALAPVPVPPRVIPVAAGVANRGGQPENQSAAKIFFVRPSTKRPRGAVPYNPSIYGGFRPPYMTSFYEENLVAGTARTLTVFSVHSPPNQSGATDMMRCLAQTPDIITAPVGTDIKILCGDFNLDFLDAGSAYSGVYGPVTAVGYRSLMDTTLAPPADAAQRQAYRGYFGTHISGQPPLAGAAASRFQWSNGANLSYYPGYRYFSNYLSIDNILVNPAGIAAPLTIMNLITGSPYVQSTVGTPALLPIIAPLGVTALASQYGNPPAPPATAWPQFPTADNFILANAQLLCGWPNHERVYSTSDHFPLVTTL